MAQLFMRIRGIDDIKGASEIKGDAQLSKGGSAIEIDSISWGVERGITMDVGNGNNNDEGAITDNQVTVTKKIDGISPSLMTLLFKPVKGRVVDFIFTVPKKTGAGVQQQYVLTLDGAKIVNYSVDTEIDEEEEEGSVPTEEVVFTSESIVSAFYPTSIDGTFGDPSPDMVSFNYETSELESGTAI